MVAVYERSQLLPGFLRVTVSFLASQGTSETLLILSLAVFHGGRRSPSLHSTIMRSQSLIDTPPKAHSNFGGGSSPTLTHIRQTRINWGRFIFRAAIVAQPIDVIVAYGSESDRSLPQHLTFAVYERSLTISIYDNVGD